MKRLALISIAVLLLAACKQTQTIVEKPVYIHDTTTTVKEVHDSTFIDRWHTVTVKGDSVFIHDSIWMYKWFVKTDTAYQYIEKPTIVTLEKVKEVKKPTPWIVKALAWIGALVIIGGVGYVAYKRLKIS